MARRCIVGMMAQEVRRIGMVDRKHKVTKIGCIDARGFLFGALVAERLHLPMILVRKQGKLPRAAKATSDPYTKEYAEATVERLCVQEGAITAEDHVYLVDDVVATGGTLLAAVQVVRAAGAREVTCGCVAELSALGARTKLENIGVLLHTAIPESAWEPTEDGAQKPSEKTS